MLPPKSSWWPVFAPPSSRFGSFATWQLPAGEEGLNRDPGPKRLPITYPDPAQIE